MLNASLILNTGETEFKECGHLCSGCYSDYVANRPAMERIAQPGADPTSDSNNNGLSGIALIVVVLASIVGGILLIGASVILYRSSTRNSRSNFRTLNLKTVTNKTTTKRHFPKP